jgi:hypothetical protein
MANIFAKGGQSFSVSTSAIVTEVLMAIQPTVIIKKTSN